MSENWNRYDDPYGRSPRPQRDQWIDFRRGENGEITTLRPMDIHPMMNVANCYWRPSKKAAATPKDDGGAT